MSGLAAQIRCAQPRLDIDIDLDAGTTVAIMGPNGAGKTTALSVLAGLRRTGGSVVSVGHTAVQDDRKFVEPHRRSVVLSGQHPRLFPHLTVRGNVEFPPAAARLGKRAARARADRWLAAVGVADLADRMPRELSGGQAQRVALARALAAEPDVLLLDEPFAALDVSVTQELRSMLRELLRHRSGVTVLVTHDLVDAVSLADQLLVIDQGQVVDRGTTREVLASPSHKFTASLSGRNLLVGTFDGHGVRVGSQRVVGVEVDTVSTGDAAAAVFSPRSVAVYLDAPHGSPRNALRAEVTDLLSGSDHAVVRTRCAEQVVDAEVTWAAATELGIAPGTQVALVIKATEVRVYPLVRS